jgi:hypothetical protein
MPAANDSLSAVRLQAGQIKEVVNGITGSGDFPFTLGTRDFN